MLFALSHRVFVNWCCPQLNALQVFLHTPLLPTVTVAGVKQQSNVNKGK